LVGDQRRPVEGRLRHRPAETGCVLEFIGKARRVDEEFLWHAAANYAGSADAVLLRDHHLGAVTGSNAGGTHAARSGADDKKVHVLGHLSSLPVTRQSKPQMGFSPFLRNSERIRPMISSPNFADHSSAF